jgi:hypothetical protein
MKKSILERELDILLKAHAEMLCAHPKNYKFAVENYYLKRRVFLGEAQYKTYGVDDEKNAD